MAAAEVMKLGRPVIGESGVISGSVMPSAPALFTLQGTLTRFRASSMTDKETGAVRWVHNLTLFQPFARRYLNCAWWSDGPHDLRPLLNSVVEFYCTSCRIADNPDYGTLLGRGIAPVNFNGSIDPALAERYAINES